MTARQEIGKNHQEKHMSPERIILTKELVQSWLSEATHNGEIKWIKITDLLNAISEMCIDGRGSEVGVATPGGNMGELALFVGTLEEMQGRPFTAEEIAEIFKFYLNEFGAFYMHTDSHAVEHLDVALNEGKVFNETHLPLLPAAEGLLEECPTELQPELLSWLTDPTNMGCGHLRLMIQKAAEYGIRPEVVQELVRQFYLEKWAGNENTELVILEGSHVEGAVVSVVQTEDPAEELTVDVEVPMISPSSNKYSAFILHPQVISFLRKTIAHQVAEMSVNDGKPEALAWLTSETVGQFLTQQTVNGGRQLGVTAGALANYEDEHQVKQPLPSFTITLQRDEEPRVA